MKAPIVISFQLPDSRYVWEALRVRPEKVVEMLHEKGGDVLINSIRLKLLPGTVTKVGKHVHDLVKWHQCDLEIEIKQPVDGATPYSVTYRRESKPATNRRKPTHR